MIESPRPDLDEAIDRVAARMVAAADDDRILPEVIARLPEREGSRWFLTMPVQVTAAVALVLMAFVFARPVRQPDPVESPSVATITPDAPAAVRSPIPFDSRSQSQLRPLAQGGPDLRSPVPVVIVRRANPVREPAILDRPDHEFSLPPADALPALELSSISAAWLAPAAMEALAPLVLTDLPLASDSSSPHER